MPIYRGPDNRVVETEEARSAKKILSRWSLDKGAVAARIDGSLQDLSVLPETDSLVEPVLSSSQEGTDIIRHSASHLLAQDRKSVV